MLNNHSNRSVWARAVAAGAALLLGAACGGGSDDGAAGNKGEWQEKYASTVKVVSDDIDRSVQALNAGQRPVVLSECTQLQEDLVDAKKALPVPDATVDKALRSAFDATDTGVKTCIEGARVASDASIVEKAQREMKVARERYSEAQKAIEAWQ